MNNINDIYLVTLAKICTGEDFWHTHEVKSLNIQKLTMSDGPHGLRKQEGHADHLGIHNSKPAICFPSASALACTFDRSITWKVGKLLGEECRSEGIHILLGPAMNIKRSPLCGRNFEYFSEDPYLTGELSFSYVKGLQSEGVGACVKHFAANNQENGRMTLSANMSKRTLYEIYLKAFERVMDAKPYAVMSSYNRINGTYVGESKELLTDILRTKWGFEGIVISDWYAVNDRVQALKAGLDLEMPGGAHASADKLVSAVKSKNLNIEELSKSANRIADVAKKLYFSKTKAYDQDEHHKIATEIASECAVLLKNDNHFLPISTEDNLLFIGEFAKISRIQGGGSSHVNPYKVTNVLDNMNNYKVDYISMDDCQKNIQKIITSKKYNKIIVFAGLTDEYESEGYDRKNLDLPISHNKIISSLTNIKNNIGVVLFHGSPIAMPWVEKVQAILSMQLSGEGSGEACANLLIGNKVPSGRLSETYPQMIEHNPSYLNSKSTDVVNYNEGVFIGYRYYTSKKIKPLFPFGYGLSYTDFSYNNLAVKQQDDQFIIDVNVTNIGKYDGKETVQLYIAPLKSQVDRPSVELKGFEKVHLRQGETKTVSFTIDKHSFSYFNEEIDDFLTEDGEYEIQISKSSEHPILKATIHVNGDYPQITISDHTTLSQLYHHPKTKDYINGLLAKFGNNEMERNMALNAPLRLVKGIAKFDEKRYNEFKSMLEKMLCN